MSLAEIIAAAIDWEKDIPDQDNRKVETVTAGNNKTLLLPEMVKRRITINDGDGYFWADVGRGTTVDAMKAHVYYVGHYLQIRNYDMRHQDVITILKDEKLPEGKKCLITSVLTAALIESLKVAPEHAGLRSQVHARIKVPLPDEAKTYEQIKEWIETNIDRSKIATMPTPKPLPMNPHVRVAATEYARGTCRFAGSRSGGGNYELTEDQILELAYECESDEEGFNRFIVQVNTWLREQVSQNMPDMVLDTGDSDIEISRVDIDNTENFNCEFNRDVVRTEVVGILQRRAPQTLQSLRDQDDNAGEDDDGGNPDDNEDDNDTD